MGIDAKYECISSSGLFRGEIQLLRVRRERLHGLTNTQQMK